MARVCPTCGGMQVGCPTCNAPPKRILPKSDIYKGRVEHRKMMFKLTSLYGVPVWEVQGIDISKWNGNGDFAVTRLKCQYVIIRYGYGLCWKDPKLDAYYAGARAQDMPVGAYWYLYDNQDPIQTADSFADEIAAHPVQLDITGDIEQTYLNPQQTLDWYIAFENRLQSRTGKLQMPYSSKGFWDGGMARSGRWASRRTWPANWTVRDYPVVPLDWTFKQGDHWQWQADGNMKAASYGFTGGDPDMDLERYYGSVVQFNVQYGTHIQPIGGQPPPPPPGQLPENVIINIGELAIHDTPALIQQNIVGHALINTIWHPFEEITVNGVPMYRVTKDGLISKAYTRIP